MNKLNKVTCLNVKHWCFIFQHIVEIHLNIYPTINTRQSDCMG